ncbi:S8 family serine peptidase, partial [bacterium]|nr:S8 family serine peptidase [bacterium]
VIRAREETGENGGERFLAAFARHLRAQLAELPWDAIQTRVTQQKGRLEIMSETLLLGMVQAQLDPVVASSGEISSDLAGQVLDIGYALQYALPLKRPMLEVYGEFIEGRRTVKRDIWADRALTLTEDMGLSEVVIAIWDSGVDMSVYEGRRFVNGAESFDGKDNDGNGFVDDVHGIAYDYKGRHEPHLLYPLGDAAPRIGPAMDKVKGLMDLQASVDSPEAAALRVYLEGLETAEVNDFLEDMELCALYVHGTHVAGIAVRDNPFARLLCARVSFDHHALPALFTEEMARRHADSYGETVAYFEDHGVRVVNMSWGWGLKEIEGILEANGWGESAAERSRQAAKLLGILEESLHEAIAGSPQILFVAAAGNEDNDVEFDEYIPSSFALPNLMIVGAVDQAGEATGFTSSGRHVRIYANGFEVKSFVPGGSEMKLSGTSMAAPNVCNLAAKLFALDPALTPPEVVRLISEGAEARGDYHLIDPRRSAASLRR